MSGGGAYTDSIGVVAQGGRGGLLTEVLGRGLVVVHGVVRGVQRVREQGAEEDFNEWEARAAKDHSHAQLLLAKRADAVICMQRVLFAVRAS